MRGIARWSVTSRRALAWLALAISAISCAGSPDETDETVETATARPAFPDSAPASHPVFVLPATFIGETGVEGARETVSLRADGLFFTRMTGTGSEGGAAHDWGRWNVSDDGRSVVLYGATEEPRRLGIENLDALVPLDAEGRSPSPASGERLRRADLYDPIRDTMRFLGEMVYMADAAALTECLTRRRFPIAMELDYAALESAYLERRSAPGAKVLVSFHGHFEERPREDGTGTLEVLLVDRFEKAWPASDCPGVASYQAPLRNTYWKLVEVLGERVRVPERQREPHMVLESDSPRLHGSLGCRSMTGSFRREESHLRFTALRTSSEKCPEGKEIENAFLRALDECTSYRIEGEELLLYGEEEAIARFVAVYLR